GEQVGNQSVPNMLSERAQNVPCLQLAAGAWRQPFQADHRVASPVGEPMVAGNDRPSLIARRLCARRILAASRRLDDELIGCQNEIPREALSGFRWSRCQETLVAEHLRGPGLVGSERIDGFPGFGGGD